MTIRKITSVVVAVLAVIAMTSCGTSRNYPNSYPYPDGRTYPSGYPDGRSYPTGYPYPERRTYPPQRYPNRMPPGQAKKVYGYKSAKECAPGQQNKQWKKNKNSRRSNGKF